MKLHEIQQKLKAPKNQFNAFGKYNYRNCEDILEAVKPLLGESALTISDEVVQIGERYYVKATATFYEGAGKTQDIHTVTAYAREAADRKGMDESQITGATSSYARKYALNGLFLIDDTKDADHDDNSKPVQKPPQYQVIPAATKAAAGDKATIKKLLADLGHKPTTVAEADIIVRKLTGLAYTEENYAEIISRLEVTAGK